jgi:predicted membrane-bound spermidine synthase
MTNRLRNVYLLLVATVMGAAVMAVEILGTRVIGSVYGSSLYVWGALISVTLVSLAIGYSLGGVLADWRPRAGLLYLLLAAGGLCTLAVPHLTGVLQPCYYRFGLRWGALASAAALFFLPLLLLGVTGPFVIRLLSRSVEKTGRTAGSIYALSTIGSVAGTLAIAFTIIPSLGTTVALRLTGGCIVGASVLGIVLEQGLRWTSAAALVAGGCLGLWARPDPPKELVNARGDRYEVVHRAESAYSRLAVLETVDERLLLANGILQTGMPWGHYELEPARLLVERGYYLELLPYLTEEPAGKRALCVGLAGGLLPSLLQLHEIEVVAVEIDPEMGDIARRFFRYNGELVIQDGRRYVEDCRETFDFCVIDAYSSDVLPTHLVTREMFEHVRRVLAPEGILALNLITDPDGWVAGSVYKTLKAVFPAVWGYRSTDEDGVQVMFLFAAAQEPDVSRRWMFDLPAGEGVAELPVDLARRRLDMASAKGIVLTDDYCPVDLIRAPEALAWRQKTIDMLGLAAIAP